MNITDEMIAAAELMLSEVLAGYDYVMPLDGMQRVLTAALDTGKVEGVAVKVKPLRWEEGEGDRLRARIGDREYLLNLTSDGETWAGSTRVYSECNLTWGNIQNCSFVTLEEAKAAAQADYERRILSTLSAPVEQQEPVATPAPVPHVVPTTSAWQWWAGSDEEWCTVGPEDTREAIIQAATNDSLGEFEREGGGWNLGFYIVEARQDPLRLADWVEADRLLERAEEGMADSDRVSSEYDDGPWFECTPEQEKDLEERVKRACDEWQAEHRLVFSCATFSHTRNREHVVVELPDDRATTEGSTDA